MLVLSRDKGIFYIETIFPYSPLRASKCLMLKERHLKSDDWNNDLNRNLPIRKFALRELPRMLK